MYKLFERNPKFLLANASANLDCSFFEREETGEALKYNSCYYPAEYTQALKHPYNRYDCYAQYVDTVNTLNAFLEGDHDKFQRNMSKLGKDYNFKITVTFPGIPFNPFGLAYGGGEEKTLREIMTGYEKTPERARCLEILENFSPPNLVYKRMGW